MRWFAYPPCFGLLQGLRIRVPYLRAEQPQQDSRHPALTFQDALRAQGLILVLCFFYSLGQRREFIAWMSRKTVFRQHKGGPLVIQPPTEKTSGRKNLCVVLHPMIELLLTCQMRVRDRGPGASQRILFAETVFFVFDSLGRCFVLGCAPIRQPKAAGYRPQQPAKRCRWKPSRSTSTGP